jgi:hypothetical protein
MDRLLARRGVWAAGHSAATTRDVVGVADLVGRLERELEQARDELAPRCPGQLAAADAGGD